MTGEALVSLKHTCATYGRRYKYMRPCTCNLKYKLWQTCINKHHLPAVCPYSVDRRPNKCRSRHRFSVCKNRSKANKV